MEMEKVQTMLYDNQAILLRTNTKSSQSTTSQLSREKLSAFHG